MFEKLKIYCKSFVPFTEAELDLIDQYFEEKILERKRFLLESGKVCNFIAFINEGTVRHFHVKEGLEKTCDISFENCWITDFQSLNYNTPSVMNLQALEKTTIFLIKKEKLEKLYLENPKFENFGRLMAEKVAQRSTEIAMSLSSSKPEERFIDLIEKNPGIFQRVPQKLIANFLGVCPESLSRIRKRIADKRIS